MHPYRNDSISTEAPAKQSKMIPERQIYSNTTGKRLMVICEVPRIADKQAAKVKPNTINTKYFRAFKINLNRGLNLLVVMVEVLLIILVCKISNLGN
jgi:hypothetical protein